MTAYHSQADLGGCQELRAVMPEPEGELYHASWEPRAMALTVAMGASGLWNIDMARAARETLPDYAHLSYYQIWLAALEKLLHSHGPLGEPPVAPPRVLHPPEVAATLARGSPTLRPTTRAARYTVGQTVRTTADPPTHHTRLPGYARGRTGIIERMHGMHVFADTNARGLGESPQWLYTVAFAAAELWGAAGHVGDCVSIDAFEPYLEPVLIGSTSPRSPTPSPQVDPESSAPSCRPAGD